MKKLVAAVSAGIYEQTPILDLNYPEDRDASVDFNVVMTEDKEFVELQGNGEDAVFTASEMREMIDLSQRGIEEIVKKQKETILNASKGEKYEANLY